MTRGSIREYAEAVRGRYLLGSKKEKGRILDEFTKVTGCHRKAAIRLFRRGNRLRTNKKCGRPRRYGPAVAGVLKVAWELKSDMAANSLIDVVQKAMDFTGMTDVPVEDRMALLSDNGAGYLSRKFGEYLRLVGVRHIVASPYHPQTNGKIERYHRSIKGNISLVPYEMPNELKEAIRAFVEYYNYWRYHEGLGNVTLYDMYTGKHLEIIQRRKEAKSRTLQVKKDYNRVVREQGNGL